MDNLVGGLVLSRSRARIMALGHGGGAVQFALNEREKLWGDSSKAASAAGSGGLVR
jgi:hypothetical protein